MKYKIYNENCLKVIDEIYNDDCILVSDPPFNIGYKYNEYKDKLTIEQYNDLIKSVFKDRKSVIIHYQEKLHDISVNFGYAPHKIVSWIYNSNTPIQQRGVAFYNIKPNFKQVIQPYKNLNDKRIQERIKRGILGGKLYDWWNINQVKNVSKEKTKHPCQMPLQVMENIIGILPYNCTIIDPFMGSGTTLVAVINMNKKQNANRKCIGIELNKEYCEIAEKRIKECFEQ